MSYFDRRGPQTLIFGSFFVIFLPLCVLSLVPNFVAALPYLLVAEVVGLGVTHFFITLALYGQSRNLRYFGSTARNRLIYFAVPAFLLLFFALTEAADLRTRSPVFALYFFGAIRFFDFFHVGRQSFGMLQIFKRPVARTLPDWSRRAENAFFVGMALLQWETFALGGRFQGDAMYARLPAVAMLALFVTVAASYLQLPVGESRRSGLRPLGYFAMQAICAASAVYDTRLYAVGLTMHYVEYHVIMAPRCLRPELDLSRRVDRAYRPLRDHAPLFYALLLATVLLFELRNHVAPGQSSTTTFLVHVFDGIFFVHYFVEAFLWKFNKPFYAETLGPLYFDQPAATAEARPTRTRRGVWLGWGLAAAACVAIALSGALARGLDALDRRVIAPMDSENHVRWAQRLAERGEIGQARVHVQHALRRTPDDGQARALLRTLDNRPREAGTLR